MRIYRVTLESRYIATAGEGFSVCRDSYNVSTEGGVDAAVVKALEEHKDRWPEIDARALEVVLLAEADL